MNRQSWSTRFTGLVVAMTVVSTLTAAPAFGQDSSPIPVDEQGNPIGSAKADDLTGYGETGQAVALSGAELDELVGPVALYPDDLLAIVLPASTYPLEIVQAARFLEQHEQDSTLQPNEDWDESVTALLNYPEVLRMMNDDVDWTWKLGDAVVNQQADVIAAVESFRDRAYAAGNLKSDRHQTVSEDDGIIEIVPVNEEIIYVPYYEPEQVVVRQVTPVYYYYPRPYPVYYYPYPVGYSFYSGYFWGVTTAFRIGWATDHLRVCHQSYWGHPYFGHSYYGHYYRSPSVYVYNSWYVNNAPYYSSNRYDNRYRDGDYWRPRTHSRSRPAYYSSRTQSYRDVDVNRESSSRSYGNSYTAQGLARDVIRDSRNDSRVDPIRFRERSETRQSIRRDSTAGATRSGTTSGTTTRTESRRSPVTTTTTGNRESAREAVVRRPATGRSDAPAVRPSNSGSTLRRDVRTGSPATRQSDNASQPIQRTVQRSSSREAARAEVRTAARSSAPERREVSTDSRSGSRAEPRQESRPAPRSDSRPEPRQEGRSESRGDSRGDSRSESRSESRQAQASVRQGSQARRDRN